jgi:uncharacterized membrane protein
VGARHGRNRAWPPRLLSRAVSTPPCALLRHWLATANVVNGLTVGGAALTPLLQARGWTPLATVLYLVYRPLCPQRPEHSYFIAGYKMAFEQRETAIYLGLLLGGLLFSPVRRWLRPLSWRGLALAALPLLIDVLSQTAGLRGSDWRWRTATGIVFALALVWWAFPYLERDLTAPAPRQGSRPTPAEHARAIVLANQDTPPRGERR